MGAPLPKTGMHPKGWVKKGGLTKSFRAAARGTLAPPLLTNNLNSQLSLNVREGVDGELQGRF